MLDATRNALAARKRLRRPANGRVSSELEILGTDGMRERRIRETPERLKTVIADIPVDTVEIPEAPQAPVDNFNTSEPPILDPADYRPPLIRDIVRATAVHFNLPVALLVSIRRTGNVTHARHVAYYLCRELTARSFAEIGRLFGDRDHTTILSGVAKIQRRLAAEPDLQSQVDEIKRRLGA